MRSGDVLVLEILTQSSVNRTAEKLMMCCGIKKSESAGMGMGYTGGRKSRECATLCSQPLHGSCSSNRYIQMHRINSPKLNFLKDSKRTNEIKFCLALLSSRLTVVNFNTLAFNHQDSAVTRKAGCTSGRTKNRIEFGELKDG